MQGRIYSFGEEGMQLVQPSKFFSSNAEDFRRLCSYYGGCIPSSPKECRHPWQAGCNRENFGGGGRLFAVLPVLLNHQIESTFPSPTCSSLLFSEILKGNSGEKPPTIFSIHLIVLKLQYKYY